MGAMITVSTIHGCPALVETFLCGLLQGLVCGLVVQVRKTSPSQLACLTNSASQGGVSSRHSRAGEGRNWTETGIIYGADCLDRALAGEGSRQKQALARAETQGIATSPSQAILRPGCLNLGQNGPGAVACSRFKGFVLPLKEKLALSQLES